MRKSPERLQIEGTVQEYLFTARTIICSVRIKSQLKRDIRANGIRLRSRFDFGILDEGASVMWKTTCIAAMVLVGLAWRLAAGEEAGRKPGARMEQWCGVHVMAWGLAGGSEALVPLQRAVAEVMAPLGVNVMILEVGYNFDYKSHPELRQSKFITRKDVKELLSVCRKHGIRLIPQFNCVGHQSWRNTLYPLLTQYRDFEEKPDDTPEKPWTGLRSWCPLHPKVNPTVFALMDELIEAFEADAFHVGMDEILVIGSAKCERCKGKAPADLLAKAINDYHKHLVDEKGLTMLMWGDRLLDGNVMKYNGWSCSKNGTAGAIDHIPKDIVICDWHYDLRAEYPSVPYFQEKGFRVWPASWNNVKAAEALLEFSRRGATERMMGQLCTTWVLEPGGFARALLGENNPLLVSEHAVQSAAALRAVMARLRD